MCCFAWAVLCLRADPATPDARESTSLLLREEHRGEITPLATKGCRAQRRTKNIGDTLQIKLSEIVTSFLER